MGIVTDYNLGRQLNHSHDVDTYATFLLKSGDTATGTIHLPITVQQGDALISSINAAATQIQAVRVSIADAGNYYSSTDVEGALQEAAGSIVGIDNDPRYRRIFILMGA